MVRCKTQNIQYITSLTLTPNLSSDYVYRLHKRGSGCRVMTITPVPDKITLTKLRLRKSESSF